MADRRKVLFRDGMSNDFLLIITDAPKEDIEKYCRWHNLMMEDGGHFELFAPLKAQHYVKELLDSEIDDLEDVDIIGYDVCYDFGQYTKLTEKIEGFRTIKVRNIPAKFLIVGDGPQIEELKKYELIRKEMLMRIKLDNINRDFK